MKVTLRPAGASTATVSCADPRAAARTGKVYEWIPCSVCGEQILTARPDQACRLTPRCPGRHKRPAKR